MMRLGLRTEALSLTAFCSRFSGMPSDCARGRSQLCLRAVIKEWSKRSAAPAAARETQPWRWGEFPAQPPLSSPFWLEKCLSSADRLQIKWLQIIIYQWFTSANANVLLSHSVFQWVINMFSGKKLKLK